MSQRSVYWRLSRLLALCFMALTATASAQEAQEGRDYTVLRPPQPTSHPEKIVVTEFFSYHCPHCFQLYPSITSWARKLPQDVVFERAAVGFGRPNWLVIAQAFYALEALGKAEQLDSAIFNAIHSQKLNFANEADITAWVAKQGVDPKQFSAAYNSFGVKSHMSRTEQMVRTYKVEGVPSLVVDGKYVVATPGIRNYDDLLARADKVIAKVRSERAK